jgi:TonB family protein
MSNLLKYLPGAAVAATALVAGGIFMLGPYGMMRERPPVCQSACVIAMGLDDDVNILFGNRNQLIGFDIDDQVTRRLIGWLDEAPGVGELEVYKYPGEVEMPERGVPGYAEAAAEAVARAQEIGAAHGARLVVIGQVLDEERVALAFIDPNAPAQQLALSEYELPPAGAPQRFASDFSAHMLAAAHGAQTLPALPPAPIGGVPPAPQLQAAAGGVAPPLPAPPRASTPPRTTIAPPPSNSTTPARAAPTPRSTAPATTQPPAYTPPVNTPPAPARQIVPARLIRDPQAAERLAAAYPQDALARGATGEVDIQCRVNVDGSLRDCAVIRNTNPAYSFAQVALAHARTRRASPQTVDGVATGEGTVLVPYRFATQ